MFKNSRFTAIVLTQYIGKHFSVKQNFVLLSSERQQHASDTIKPQARHTVRVDTHTWLCEGQRYAVPRTGLVH